MDQSSQDNTLVGVRPPGPPARDAVSFQSSRDAIHERSPAGTPSREGRAIRFKITPLGGSGRTVSQIAGAIVGYLKRKDPLSATVITKRASEEGATRYYSEGTDEPGRWLGRGAAALGLGSDVDDSDFAAVLSGRDPRTGQRLISARGSAGRRPRLGVGTHSRRSPDGQVLYDVTDSAAVLGVTKAEIHRMLQIGALVVRAEQRGFPGLQAQPPGSYLRPTHLDGQVWVTHAELSRCDEAREAGTTPEQAAATGAESDVLALAEAARIAGVTKQYLRRLAKRHETMGAQDNAGLVEGLVEGLGHRHAYLVAHRGPRNEWLVERRDLVDFLRRRRPPAVRVGYDLTLTTEKSLGVLALLSDEPTRRTVLDAIRQGNDRALVWLETHHAVARENREVVPTKGWTVASFRHYTSRALDPFPHHHNVVANTAEDHKGVRRALDARSLYQGAKAASALATAEMRHQLTKTLGVRCRPSRHGGWEIAGIPDEVLQEFSRRRNEIDDVLHEIEDAIGRGATVDEIDQVVLTTRPAKTEAPAKDLLASWWARAATLGFEPEDLAACTGLAQDQVEPDPAILFAQLAAPDGLCRNLSVFNRGDLLHALVNLPVVTEDEDENEEPQPLLVTAARLEEIADAFLASPWVEQLAGATDNAPARFSTREMLALQQRIVTSYSSGLRQRFAQVPAATVDRALAGHPRLTAEQVALVRAFCTSGHRIQCAIGHPGAGKTTSMRAAREAWEAGGLRVVGAAVKGEAARTLAAATGIPTETLAWHLAHDDPLTSPLDSRTVLVVDEASTVSDRDVDRLVWIAEQTGGTLRFIGDPAQHGAVEAGGMFRVLCERNPRHTPELTQTHRLRDPHDRAAAEALRVGNVAEALGHLAAAGHLHLVEDETDSYVQVLANWWRAHQDGQDHPMVDRRNDVRRALNRLAHALREAAGELGSDAFISHERRFAVGDRVIARAPNRRLHPPEQRSSYVRNGAIGTIVGITDGHPGNDASIAVAFDDVGAIELPRAFVDEHEITPGQQGVGLDHAYAVTSYAVTGATQPVSTSRIDEDSSRAETYVDITRGENANHLYLTRASDPLDGEHLPRLPPDPIAQTVAERLQDSTGEKTAWEIRQAAIDQSERQLTLEI